MKTLKLLYRVILHKEVSFVKRSFLICSYIQLRKELNVIRNIALDHGFPIKYLNKIINKFKYLIIHSNNVEVTVHRFKKFQFQYISVLYERLRKFLIKFDIHLVVFTSLPFPNLLERIEIHLDVTSFGHRAGIYGIPIYLDNDLLH